MNRSLAFIAALATAALTSLPALAQDANPPPPPPAPPPAPIDRRTIPPTAAELLFVADAAKDGMAEVQMGQLALQKGTNDAVKALGQHLVDDHTKANDELKQIASANEIPVPATVGADHQKEIAKLEKLHGASFDKEFARLMVRDHKKAIDRFQKASNDVDIKVPALKSFARGTVPALEHHLDMARGVKSLVKTEK